jgi:hypothetical protein
VGGSIGGQGVATLKRIGSSGAGVGAGSRVGAGDGAGAGVGAGSAQPLKMKMLINISTNGTKNHFFNAYYSFLVLAHSIMRSRVCINFLPDFTPD